MSDSQIKIIQTDDGSRSLYSEKFKEGYHSKHGAIQESQHVFIENGLKFWKEQNPEKSQVRIFEMGFGTGLNAFLTFRFNSNSKIYYTAVEKYPVTEKVIQTLGYDLESQVDLIQGDLLDFETNQTFDVIYFDAFSPDVQPELWSESVFQKIFQMCDPGAVFVTYCAKGDVRRSLVSVGFQVEKLPGPPGKRHMLRAVK